MALVLRLWCILLTALVFTGCTNSQNSGLQLNANLNNKQLNLEEWDFPNPSGQCPKLNLNWDSKEREGRFPSVQDRICLYMTRWYDPRYLTPDQWKSRLSFSQDDNSTLSVYKKNRLVYVMENVENHLENDIPFFMFKDDRKVMSDILNQKHWLLIICYSFDTEKVCDKFQKKNPILFVWGDQEMKIGAHLPIIGKWRFNDITQHTMPVPIVAPLDTNRHFGSLQEVYENDIPWDLKENKAVWRGDMTGIIEGRFPYHFPSSIHPLETCMKFPRCRLVYRNHNATHTDIGFSSCSEEGLKNINGISMMRPHLSMKDQLKFKMLISIEGNDVATGLKWNLLSNSVVLMPPPTKSIFSLEVLLEPWVHYVPLDIDNVNEAIQWVLENDDKAKEISDRAKNFIEDLFFHPNAAQDSENVLQEIADRISAIWT